MSLHHRQKQHESRTFSSKYFLLELLCKCGLSFKVSSAALLGLLSVQSLPHHKHILSSNLSSQCVLCCLEMVILWCPHTVGDESQNKHAQLAKSSDCISQFCVKSSASVRVHGAASLSTDPIQAKTVRPGKLMFPCWTAETPYRPQTAQTQQDVLSLSEM